MVAKLTIWTIWAASGLRCPKMVPKLAIRATLGDLGPERNQNKNKTEHLKHLGSLRPEMIQYGTKTDHLEHLGDHGPKLCKMV